MSTRVIAVSKAVQQRFNRNPDWETKTMVVHNGIAPEWFQDLPRTINLRDQYGLGSDSVCLGIGGRIAPEKCQDTFVKIISRLVKRSCPIAGFIAGEIGDNTLKIYKQNLQNQIRELKLDQHLFFLGHIKDMRYFMDAVDIFVLPSKREPFGLVTLEAMARRKPVVAFATGGTPEIIEDGSTGVLFQDGDWEKMAEGIEQLISKPERREQIGTNAQIIVKKQFRLDTSMRQINTVIEELIHL